MSAILSLYFYQIRNFGSTRNRDPERVIGSCWDYHAIRMHYNFVRIHKSLSMTPAMAAGVTEHLWEIEDIVKLLDN